MRQFDLVCVRVSVCASNRNSPYSIGSEIRSNHIACAHKKRNCKYQRIEITEFNTHPYIVVYVNGQNTNANDPHDCDSFGFHHQILLFKSKIHVHIT